MAMRIKLRKNELAHLRPTHLSQFDPHCKIAGVCHSLSNVYNLFITRSFLRRLIEPFARKGPQDRINAKSAFLAQTKGRRERERERKRKGKRKGKIEVKLWQKRKKIVIRSVPICMSTNRLN